MPGIRIRVPAEVANELVESGEAMRSPTTRDSTVVEVLHFVVEGVSAAAGVVTLVAEVEVYRRFARLLRKHAAGRAVMVEAANGRRELSAEDAHPGPPRAADSPDRAEARPMEDDEIVRVLAAAQEESNR